MKKIAVGILAHVDSGKTTLSEALMYSSGNITKLGRVDHRDSFLDTFSLERDRGIPIINWTIGYSGLYHIPDIPGYRVGIKTVERDKFPIIFKDNSYPQIICIKSTKYNNLIFVCGLATSNVLNNYQDDDLILDPNLRARGTKTGFYGFEQLVPIKSLNDLSTYKK